MSAAVLQFTPRIGARWRGGTFAGDGLIVGPLAPTPLTHHEAIGWAASLHIGTYADYRLPMTPELIQIRDAPANQLPLLHYWASELVGDSDAMTYRAEIDRAIHWGRDCQLIALAVRRD